METTNIRRANSGSFKKGQTPWNKGTNKGGRTDDGVRKGKQGFARRPVVSIRPDGSILKRYASMKEAAKAYGIDRHAIINACKGKFYCQGLMWKYEEDYVAWADYSYKRPTNRDKYGRIIKGQHFYAPIKPENRERAIERHREVSKRRIADPNDNWGKPHGRPVRCLTTGEDFPSITAAAEHFGVKRETLSSAMYRNCRLLRKYWFIRL